MKVELVRFKQHTMIVREMTVGDVLFILANLSEGFDAANLDTLLTEKRSLISHTVRRFIDFPAKMPPEKLTDEQIEILIAAFMRVNARFFDNGGKGKAPLSQNAQRYYQDKLKTDINQTVITLIERGHRDVLNYSWSFYRDVIDVIKAAQS